MRPGKEHRFYELMQKAMHYDQTRGNRRIRLTSEEELPKAFTINVPSSPMGNGDEEY
jgi:hypothetical protein